MRFTWFLCSLLLCTALTGPSRGDDNAAGSPPAIERIETDASPPMNAGDEPPEADVRLGDRVLVTLRKGYKGRSPRARAQAATLAIEKASHHEASREVSVRWLSAGDPDSSAQLARIFVGQTLVLELGPADWESAENHEDARAAVQSLSLALQEALDAEQHRMKIADWVLAGSSVVFLGLLALLLLRGVGRWSRAASEWTYRDEASIGPVRVASIDLIPAGAVREVLRVGILGGSWIVRLALIYFWAIWSLSLFEVTRPAAGSATSSLLRPLAELFGRIASQIPVVVALLVSLFVVGLLMRFVAAYFHAIERGDIESDWADPATARVTGGLLLIVLTLLTLLFLAPFVTGSKDGVFSQLGILALGALALSVSPLMVSCALGVRLVYSRSLHLGDELNYGGRRGRVRQIGLFDVVLEPLEGGSIRVPHLMSLWHPTQVFALPRRGAGDGHPDSTHPDSTHPDSTHPDSTHPDSTHSDRKRRHTENRPKTDGPDIDGPEIDGPTHGRESLASIERDITPPKDEGS